MVTNSLSAPPPPPPALAVLTLCLPNKEPKYGLWELDNIKTTTHEWIDKARAKRIANAQSTEAIDQLQAKIDAIVRDAPPLQRADNGALVEVAINQQMYFHCFYCNQVIYEDLLADTAQLEQKGLAEPSLSSMHDMIRSCARFIRRQVELQPQAPFQLPETTQLRCLVLRDKIDEMQTKILAQAERVERANKRPKLS